MATISDARAVNATLSGTTADVVQLTQAWDHVEVVNLDATDVLYVTQDGTTPTAGSEGAIAVGPNSSVILSPIPAWTIPNGTAAIHTIRVVGDGGAYSVAGFRRNG